jgi:hypothetical protein
MATMIVAAAMSGHWLVYWLRNPYRPLVTGHRDWSDSMTSGRMRLFQLATKPNTANAASAGFICGMMIRKMNRR